jgi:hypothetical protein
MLDNINSQDKLSCGIGKGEGMKEKLEVVGKYSVECVGPDGVVKWTEDFDNLVTTAGKNALLSIGIGPTARSAGWYVGLKATGTALAVDTMASHASWAEIVAGTIYTGTRQVATFGAASGGVATMTQATFAIIASSTIYGCFICDSASGTTGILYSAGDFGASKAVSNLDTLNVNYTTTLA